MKQRLKAFKGLSSHVCGGVFLFALLLLLRSAIAFAETSDSKDGKNPPEAELPQTGLLAAYGELPFRELNLQETWGGTNPPIVASITWLSRAEWSFVVENKAEVTYDIVVEFVQMNLYQERAKTDKFYLKIKPGKKEERRVRVGKKVVGAGVLLQRWKTAASKAK